MKKWKNVFFINFVPIILIHILFLIFELLFKADSITELIFDAIVIPIYLVVINILYCIKHNKNILKINLILMVLSSITGIFFSYFNWGITTKLIFNPDLDTIFVYNNIVIINLILIITFSLGFQLVIFLKNWIKKSKNTIMK